MWHLYQGRDALRGRKCVGQPIFHPGNSPCTLLHVSSNCQQWLLNLASTYPVNLIHYHFHNHKMTNFIRQQKTWVPQSCQHLADLRLYSDKQYLDEVFHLYSTPWDWMHPPTESSFISLELKESYQYHLLVAWRWVSNLSLCAWVYL